MPTTTMGSTATGGTPRSEPGDAGGGVNPVDTRPETGGAGGAVDAVGGEHAGGEGGAPSSPVCPSRIMNDWELGYFPELDTATTQESHPFFQVTNRSVATTLDRLAIRYYFTKESAMAETALCYWVTGDRCSLAKMEFHDLPVAIANASRYLEVSFPGASNVTVAAGALEVRVGFRTGSDALLQSNDYSFDAHAAATSSTMPFPYKRWPQATLYLNGALVWGTEPCMTSGEKR